MLVKLGKLFCLSLTNETHLTVIVTKTSSTQSIVYNNFRGLEANCVEACSSENTDNSEEIGMNTLNQFF